MPAMYVQQNCPAGTMLTEVLVGSVFVYLVGEGKDNEQEKYTGNLTEGIRRGACCATPNVLGHWMANRYG